MDSFRTRASMTFVRIFGKSLETKTTFTLGTLDSSHDCRSQHDLLQFGCPGGATLQPFCNPSDKSDSILLRLIRDLPWEGPNADPRRHLSEGIARPLGSKAGSFWNGSSTMLTPGLMVACPANLLGGSYLATAYDWTCKLAHNLVCLEKGQ